MRSTARLFTCIAIGFLTGACSPTFNWREVPVADAGLVALMPCTTDKASRSLPLGGTLSVAVDMVGCEAGGATFAIAHATAADMAQAERWLGAWRDATRAQLAGASAVEAVGKLPRAAVWPAPQKLTANGAQILWFAQRDATGGVSLYQATVSGKASSAEAADTFFEGLRLP